MKKRKNKNSFNEEQLYDRELALLLSESFSGIKCEEELKSDTAEKILKASCCKENIKSIFIPSFLKKATVAALAVIIIAVYGIGAYTSPAAAVSLDGTVSVKIVINRFNKVVSADYYNDGGKKALENIKLKGSNYSNAVDSIIQYEKKHGKTDVVLCIGINSDDSDMAEKIEKQVRINDNKTGVVLSLRQNTSAEEKKADKMHLTCYRYRVFRYLKSEGVSITLKKTTSLSIKELEDLIKAARSDKKAAVKTDSGCLNSDKKNTVKNNISTPTAGENTESSSDSVNEEPAVSDTVKHNSDNKVKDSSGEEADHNRKLCPDNIIMPSDRPDAAAEKQCPESAYEAPGEISG